MRLKSTAPEVGRTEEHEEATEDFLFAHWNPFQGSVRRMLFIPVRAAMASSTAGRIVRPGKQDCSSNGHKEGSWVHRPTIPGSR